jgi:predicted dehydrogenase
MGKMGQTRADALEKEGRARIVKVFDIKYECPVPYPKASSIEEVIADRSIEAVFICLPNKFNKPTTIAALDAGKHVFCEKPPAFNAAEVREIIDAERRSGRVLMYGFNHRHHASVEKMKNLIDSDDYGKVIWLRGRYGKSVDQSYFSTWRAKKDMAGGGILIDQGIHMLDLCLYLTKATFDEVHALVSTRYWNLPGIEDNVFALMRDSTSGVEASIHSTMTQWRHLFSLEVFLERGYLVLNGLKTSSNSYGEEILSVAKNRTTAPAASWDSEDQYKFDVDVSWDREAIHFFDAVCSGRPVEYGTSADALAVMSLIDRIYESERPEAKRLHTSLLGSI